MITCLSIAIGFILSIISWLGICSSACADTHNYRYFNFHFESVGLAFFTAVGLGLAYIKKSSIVSYIIILLLAAGFGSEMMFIFIQKFAIKHWCPICLSIAATVGIAFISNLADYFQNLGNQVKQKKQGVMMETLWKGISIFSIFILGFILAMVGVAKPDESFAATEDPVFGNKQSPIDVYIITDWFCPACKKAEPALDKMYPTLLKKASLIFVDKAIHPETLNYTPFNLAFMLNDKSKYFEIRKALRQLAETTKTPSEAQIAAAVAPLGVSYHPLNYADIDSGLRFFEGIAKTFDVHSTPTIVIANRKKITAKKITDANEITEENILKLITELSN